MIKELSEERLFNLNIGDPITCRGWIVNNRFLALSAEEVNMALDKLFREHDGERFTVEVVQGTFHGVLNENGWEGSFKIDQDTAFAIIDNETLGGFIWISAV